MCAYFIQLAFDSFGSQKTLIRIYHFGKGLFCSDRRNPSYKSISSAWAVATIDTDYDYDLDSDRSKRLNDILAGHDIALLKMVKKVTLENLFGAYSTFLPLHALLIFLV